MAKPAAGAAGEGEVRFRLIRADDAPATNPEGDAFVFGLQDTQNQITPAERLPDGRLCWDFALRVKPGKNAEEPNFLGRFASGPADDRFVYLSWFSVPRKVWINRVKAQLRWVGWDLVRAAQTSGRTITADLTGRTPHSMQRIDWRLD